MIWTKERVHTCQYLSFGHHPEHKISNNQKYDHDIHNSQIEWKSPASYKCLGASQNLNIDWTPFKWASNASDPVCSNTAGTEAVMYECNASSSSCHCCISFGGVELFGAFHFDTACFDDAYDVAHVESRMNMMSVMPLYRLALVRFPFLPFIVGVVGCWMVGYWTSWLEPPHHCSGPLRKQRQRGLLFKKLSIWDGIDLS